MKNDRVIYRRIRGRVVAIKPKRHRAAPKQSAGKELGMSYGVATAAGVVSGALVSKRRMQKAVYGFGNRIMFRAAKGEKPPLFSVKRLPKGIKGDLKTFQRALGVTEASKGRAIIKLAGATRLLKPLAAPILVGGGLISALGAYGAAKRIFKPRRGDGEITKAVKDLSAVAAGVGAFTFANYGFARATGRGHIRAMGAAIRTTPAWIKKVVDWKATNVTMFKGVLK